MKTFSWSLACLALATAIGCGGTDSHEKVMGDTVATIDELVVIISGVKDEAAAKAAAPKIEAVATKMEAIKKRADKLGKPSADAEKKLQEKYGPQLMGSMFKMMPEMMRIQADPKLAEPMKAAMEKLEKTSPGGPGGGMGGGGDMPKGPGPGADLSPPDLSPPDLSPPDAIPPIEPEPPK